MIANIYAYPLSFIYVCYYSIILYSINVKKNIKMNYLLINEIGKGTYGRCFMAVNSHTKKYFACKVTKRSATTPEDKILATLKHTNIIKLIEVIKEETYTYLILELCPYGTLADLLKCRINLTDPEVRCITRQIVSGVCYLHENMIIHRDLKLSNLLISPKFEIKICDFGLSAKLEESSCRRNTVCGTYDYMAPEISQGENYGFAVDIWSVGCLLFNLLEGYEPKKDGDCETSIYKRACRNNHIPLLARKLLHWTFNKDPSQRPTAHEVLHHDFLNKGRTLSQLSIASFYEKPIVGRELKRLPLTDCTNRMKHNVSSQSDHRAIIQKKSTLTMTLRSQRILQFPLEKDRNLTTLIKTGGKPLAEQLSSLLRQCISSSPPNKCLLYKTEEPFLFVNKWVAGNNTLGYQMSDGSISIHFDNNQVTFYKKDKEEKLMSPTSMTINSLHPMEAYNLRQTLYYVDCNLKPLADSGPSYYGSEPVVILAKKFFHNADDGEIAPVATFLLSNGSCQINLSNHDKLIVNPYEDLIVSWNPEEIMRGYFRDMLQMGTPRELKTKLEFMCYFLTVVHCL